MLQILTSYCFLTFKYFSFQDKISPSQTMSCSFTQWQFLPNICNHQSHQYHSQYF